MHAHGDGAEIDLAPIGPDAADEGDAALAQADREIGEIGIGGGDGLRPAAHALAALAARALDIRVRHLLQARRPDELAADARAAVDARDRRALGGGEPVDVLEARPLDDACVSSPPRSALSMAAPASPPSARPAIAPEGPADHAADDGADGLQNDGGHQTISGKRNAWARWRRHQGRNATSATAGAVMGVDHGVGRGRDGAVLGRAGRRASGRAARRRPRIARRSISTRCCRAAATSVSAPASAQSGE